MCTSTGSQIIDHSTKRGCGYCMVAVVISLVLYSASPGWVVGLGRAGGTKVMISLNTLSKEEIIL